MRRHPLAGLTAMILTAALTAFPAYAHDIEWGIRHGEQDALLLGTVAEVGDGWAVLDEVIPLPCKNDSTIYRQLEPDQVPGKLKVTDMKPYAISYHGREQAEVGDCMIVSTDRDGQNWKSLYRPYEVSSADPETLEFLPEKEKTGEGAAWEAFVHSGGDYNEFCYSRDGQGDTELVTVRIQREDGSTEETVVFEAAGAESPALPQEDAQSLALPPPQPAPESAPPPAAAESAAPAPGIPQFALAAICGGIGFLAAFVFTRRKK